MPRPACVAQVTIKDNDNGTYLVEYIVPSAEEYIVTVELGDLGDIRGSPFKMTAKDPWTRPKINGVPPVWNESLQMCVVARRLVLYGGEALEEGTDVLVLDTDMWRWVAPKVNGTPPQCRQHFTLCSMGDKNAIVFGGRTVQLQSEKDEEEAHNTKLQEEYTQNKAEYVPTAPPCAELHGSGLQRISSRCARYDAQLAALKAAEAAEEELEEGAAPVEKKERPEPPALPTFMKWKSSLLQARFCALARGGGCVDPQCS
jgi:hypothetical protein